MSTATANEFVTPALDEGAGPVLAPGTLPGRLLPSYPVRPALLAPEILVCDVRLRFCVNCCTEATELEQISD